jgi:hypothetical protein
MNRQLTITAVFLVVAGATGFGLRMMQSTETGGSISEQTGVQNSTKRRITPEATAPATARRTETPFWSRANVPEPAVFREAAGVDPASLGVHQDALPPDFPAELARLLGDENSDTKVLNSLMLDWLALDEASARAWLEEAESLTPWQPAIRNFTGRVATDGNCDLALQWAEFVEAPDEHERLLTDIYSKGFQSGRFNRQAVATAPIPEADRENILNGSRRN